MSDRIRETGRRYTYEDYVTWNDDKRWEIIEGIPYGMTLGPTWVHQGILEKRIGRAKRLYNRIWLSFVMVSN